VLLKTARFLCAFPHFLFSTNSLAATPTWNAVPRGERCTRRWERLHVIMIPQLISADIGKGKIIFAATLEWHLPIKYNTLVTKKKHPSQSQDSVLAEAANIVGLTSTTSSHSVFKTLPDTPWCVRGPQATTDWQHRRRTFQTASLPPENSACGDDW